MKTFAYRTLLVLSLVTSATLASAGDERPYTEGPVTELSFIRIKPGMYDAYMRWIATDRKKQLDEEKKAGIIIDSKVYVTEAHNPNEPDLILAETYANMAAFDGLQNRVDGIADQINGSKQKMDQAEVDRERMRDVLGSQLIREMVLK